jgi:hypothetical protein
MGTRGVRLDPAKTDARHDAQVRLAVASGRCSVLVLGGSHDLSASMRKLGGGVEYIRVTTARYREIAGRTRVSAYQQARPSIRS